jgi:transposase
MIIQKLLSQEQVKSLQSLLAQTDNEPIRQRIMMLLLKHDGKTYLEIADILGCSLRTVTHWCNYANPDDPDSFSDKRQIGNRKKVTEAYMELLRETVEICPQQLGLDFNRWTAEKLADYLAEKTGIQVSGEQVRRLLKEKFR